MTQKSTGETQGDCGGNTKSPQSGRYRKWVFTLNNYTKEQYEGLRYYLEHRKHTKFIIGKEVGASGTPHLQGYINSKNPISFQTLKNLCNQLHLEKAKGSDVENYNYCSKEGDFFTNFEMDRKNKFLKKYENIIWKEWQNNILDILKTKPNDRTINWITDNTGNKGKSFLSKFIYLKYNCILADGKKDNVFNQVLKFYEENINEEIEVIILDIPRHNLEYINYGCLEQLKNGLIYSGKYEGGVCVFESPHVIIMANENPDITKFSMDRWNIINLDEDPLGST